MCVFILDTMADTLNIAGECILCGNVQTVVVKSSAYKQWKNGVPPEVAFPLLNKSDQNIFRHGICDECMPDARVTLEP